MNRPKLLVVIDAHHHLIPRVELIWQSWNVLQCVLDHVAKLGELLRWDVPEDRLTEGGSV